MMPSLRVLDFQKVSKKEREEAKRRFQSEQGAAQIMKDLKEREEAIGGGAGKKRRASER